MRIGIDAHAAEQDGTGNATYYRNLILHLASLDSANDYFIFATNPKHPFYRDLEGYKNFKIIEITGSPAWFRVFVSLPLASHKTKIDVLHIQYFAPWIYHGRLVNTIHDLAAYYFPEYFSLFERFLFKWLLPYSSRKADRILTASEVSKRDLINILKLPEEKISVSFCGVSDAFRQSISMEQIDYVRGLYNIHGKFLLYVGRIDPRKNLVRLIQAYTDLRQRGCIEHKLVIAGKLYLKPPLLQRTIRQSPFSKDILFCGYVKYEHLPVLYRASDLFIYTSEYEGFGLPPLEAMASGVPVVASDIPIFREILGDGAVFVNPRNIQAISDGILKIIQNDQFRCELIEKGIQRITHYSWNKTATITLETYRNVRQHKEKRP